MTEEIEEWRPIVGWEGLYEISSLARVRSLARSWTTPHGRTARWPGKILSQAVKNGWPTLTIAHGGKQRRSRTAYLVAESFTEWALDAGMIEFADANPLNAKLKNLRFRPISAHLEEWRACFGYEGYYEVSSLGRVRSLGRTIDVDQSSSSGALRKRRTRQLRPRIMRPGLTNGYPALALRRNGEFRSVTVHSLVCTAFHGPRPPNHDACHRDGVRTNATASNLYWGTRRRNEQDKYVTRFAEMAGISLAEAWAMVARAGNVPGYP
jgi:hypothetical protein